MKTDDPNDGPTSDPTDDATSEPADGPISEASPAMMPLQEDPDIRPSQAGPRKGRSDPHDFSHETHRQLIGYLGLLLPVVLVLLAGIRPTAGLEPWAVLDSVSAYYYTGAVAAFVGILFALSLFLFSYGGYQRYRADRIAGSIGGFCALGVAFFPCEPPAMGLAPTWWSEIAGTIHYVSAVLLFVSFIVFSLWLFRKTDTPKGEEIPKGKRQRNQVYLACGIIMVAAVLWAGIAGLTGRPIFWAEIVALSAFAVSWLVKGYAHRSVTNTVKKVLAR
jgi:hypothetical protein